jgi:transposase
MIALLRYGSGFPWYRLEGLQENLGIPLPVATQCEIVKETAAQIQPAMDELIRQAAQGKVMHNDDTSMRVLSLDRGAASDVDIAAERTGVFTSGIVSISEGYRIGLYFTGRKHAGENLAGVLKQRAAGLAAPIQMCDALLRNLPKKLEVIIGHCLAHARRHFVEVTPNFPQECRFVLESLGEVYGYDEIARAQRLSPEQRLHFHQEHSGPVMEKLHIWLDAQFDERRVEPNSGLGQAISYLLKHWDRLTLFLRQAGAPLDNNVCTAARGSADIMPTAGLCRVGVAEHRQSRGISDFRGSVYRHNHRLSRKASKGSGGRKRSGVRPDEVACASARSLSCMSACR